jgi:hypothetical protein
MLDAKISNPPADTDISAGIDVVTPNSPSDTCSHDLLLPDRMILIQPRNGDSFDGAVKRAVKVLRDAEILSGCAGRTIDDRPAIIIDPADLPEALAILDQAGFRVTAN